MMIDRGCAEAGASDRRDDLTKGGKQSPLLGSGGPLHPQRRAFQGRGRRPAIPRRCVPELLAHGHVKTKSPTKVGKFLRSHPEGVFLLVLVAGDGGLQRGREIAMRQRDAGISGRRQRRGDARNNLEGDPIARQTLGLFPHPGRI